MHVIKSLLVKSTPATANFFWEKGGDWQRETNKLNFKEFGLEFKEVEECCLRARSLLSLHLGEAWAFQIICNIISGLGFLKPFVYYLKPQVGYCIWPNNLSKSDYPSFPPLFQNLSLSLSLQRIAYASIHQSMCASLVTSSCIKLLRYCPVFLPPVPKTLLLLTRSRSPRTLLLGCSPSNTSPFASCAHSSTRSDSLSLLCLVSEKIKKLQRKRNLYCHCFYWFN